MTLLSRVLGLVRDVCIAWFLGASASADAFFIAFKIPQFLRRLFAEGAFSQAFVPVLSEYREQRTHSEVQAFINAVGGVLGSSLIMVSVLAVVAAPVVTAVFAPGFLNDPEKYQLTTELVRITFPYLFLISMTGFAGAILNSYGRFAIPAFTPIWLNISLIVGAVWVSGYMETPVMALAWAVLVAGAVQLAFQMPSLYRLKLLPKPTLDTKHDGMRRVLLLMVPALFGVSVSQINLLLDTVLASFLPTGSVAWLYYSDRLVELPLGVFGIAIATVILPSLSRKHTAAAHDSFSQTLEWGLRFVFLVGVPAMVALIILAEPILATLFEYGKTTAADIKMSSLSLQAYALGLLPFMLIKILATGYYSRQDTKTPVKIGIIAMLSNMVLNIAFLVPLYYWFNVGHVGLALATSASAALNAGLLYRGLKQRQLCFFSAEFKKLLFKVAFAAMVMGEIIYLLSIWLNAGQGTWAVKVASLLGVCLIGAGVYFALLRVMGLRPRHFSYLEV